MRRVSDVWGVRQFAEVHESLQPAGAVAHFASLGALLSVDVAAYVLRVGGQAVACAMMLASDGVAGVYWVATRADSRRRGYGELVTRAAVRGGFEYGARAVILQSTELGAPLYRRLGFREFTTYARLRVQ